MIRGINRQVLEVNNTENEYFEKVVFYVKPEHATTAGDRLNYEASVYARSSGKPPKTKAKKKEKFKIACEFVGTFLLGGGCATILMNILG